MVILVLLQVSRRLQHRSLLIFHLPSLLSLDGVMVTTDERHVAQMTFGSLHEPHVSPISCLPSLIVNYRVLPISRKWMTLVIWVQGCLLLVTPHP